MESVKILRSSKKVLEYKMCVFYNILKGQR